MRLTTRFSSKSFVLRRPYPLSDDDIRAVAPSIFAESAHSSRSDRYTYISTATVLNQLRSEGFLPFMVCQARSRIEDRRPYSKHMIRLRQTDTIEREEANEVILINAHDGTSRFQLVKGMVRFACQNGLVHGDIEDDIRVPHSGDVVGRVIEGAYRVASQFGLTLASREDMRALILNEEEAHLFARSALALKYDDPAKPAPITEAQILQPRRQEDERSDMWSIFNRVQENLIQGGVLARVANGFRRTRAIQGIDQNIRLNRALWKLAEGIRQLKR